MNKVFLSTLTLVLISINFSFADILTKEINSAKQAITDTAVGTKYVMTPPKQAKSIIEKAVSKIENECCEDNFKFKKDIQEIKNNLNDCLNKKCQNFMLPLFSLKKPPAKIVALKQANLIDDLLMENEKQKYDNLVAQMELDLNKKQKKQKEAQLQNEKNIEIVKNQLIEKEKENEKLKNTVNKLLINYQKKIAKLKKEKQTLENNFNIVFEAHTKNKQKKLTEQLK